MGKDLTEGIDTLNTGERQQKFLLQLSDALRLLSNPVDIEAAATKIAMDFLDADRCYYNTLEDGNAIVQRDAFSEDLTSLAGVYPISSFPLFKSVVDKGHPFVVDDVNTSNIVEEGLRQVCVQVQVISFINVPVIKNGKPVGVLSLVQSEPRKWTDAEVLLTKETAERIWAAVERAKAEEAVHKSEEKYRTLLTSIDQGFTLCELIRNKEGKGIDLSILEVNATYEKQTGVTKEMVIGKPLLQVFPSLGVWMETYAAVVDNQRPVVFEQYFEDTDRWFAIKAYPVEKEKFAVLFSNITERKLADEKIKESENRFHTMADASPVLMWTIDANGLSSYYNKTFRDFIGATRDEDISDWKNIVHPDDVHSTFDTINTAIAERRSYSLECRLLRADGNWRWVLAQGNPSNGANNEFLGFVGSSVDITERKEAEVKIKESEQRFQNLIYSSPSAIGILMGPDLIITTANKAIIDIWGKGKEIVGKSYFKALPELADQGYEEVFNEVYTSGKAANFAETPVHILQNGKMTLKYYDFVLYPQRNGAGDVEGIGIIAAEVTPQAEKNNRIKDSESRFRNLVRDTAAAIVVLTGPEMIVEIVNEAYGNLIERTPDELINKPLFSIIPETEAYYRPLLNKVYLTGEPVVLYDSPYALSKDEKTIEGFLHIVYQPYRNEEGNILGVMVICQDVTDSVKSKKALQESEAKFRSVIADAPVVIGLFVGRDLIIEDPNQAFIDVVGKGWGIVGKPLRDAMPELITEGQPYLQILDDVYTSGKTFKTDGSLVKIVQNGVMTHRYYNFTYTPLLNTDGQVWAILDIAIDVTEQIKATQKVQESEERFRSLADQSPMIVYIVEPDAAATMSYFNETWLNYTGQSFEQAIGRAWDGIVHPDDLPGVFEIYVPAFQARESYTLPAVRLKRHDGKYRWHMFKGNARYLPTGEFNGFIGVAFDIHEQKLAEEKLAYRTALLEAHNQASADGILLVEAKGKIISFNQRFIEIWNIPQHIVDAKDDEAALSFAMTQLVEPQKFIDKGTDLYENPIETTLDELDFKDGKVVERNGYPVIGEDGIYYAWSWTFRDITKQKNYEIKIRESESRFRTLAETLPQLVWMTDAKGTYEYASNQWFDYSGLDPYAEDTWGKLVHPDDMDSLMEVWASSLLTGEDYHAEVRLKNKAGAYRWHLVQGEPIKNEKGTITKWIGAFTDIENLKEEQKQKDDFLSMASHELKTPVTTIKAYGQILERILEEKDDAQTLDLVKKMSKQVNRLTTLITDLLDVTKMQKGGLIRNVSVFNFNELVKDIVDDMQKTIDTHQIIDQLDADINISGDKDKLGQVLNNLISNATKYSPGADRIIVSTQIVNNGIQLKVRDFGIGISREAQKNVFKQFYRVTGENQSLFQGMGIGLYICAEIIKREAGKIWVESAIGKGSVFYVWLPIDQKKKTELVEPLASIK